MMSAIRCPAFLPLRTLPASLVPCTTSPCWVGWGLAVCMPIGLHGEGGRERPLSFLLPDLVSWPFELTDACWRVEMTEKIKIRCIVNCRPQFQLNLQWGINLRLFESREKIPCEQMVCRVQQLYLSFCKLPIVLDSKPAITSSKNPKLCNVSWIRLQKDKTRHKPRWRNIFPGAPMDSMGTWTLQGPLANCESRQVTELNGAPVPSSVKWWISG